ncbi:MAG: hypothetical protein Q8920_09115 [Bacillota bacterium]|nr:hypothetical protein [Bacillota bacterium]
MYKYLLEHEKRMLLLLDSNEVQDWEAVKAYHEIQIGFMQHERLIHLIVTIAIAFIMLGCYTISAINPCIALAALDLIITILELFYIIHYYRLENGVQRWYRIHCRICERSGLLEFLKKK